MNFKYLVVLLDYGIKNLILLIVQKALFNKIKDKNSILSIVIFRTGSIGDSVCTIPALINIRNNFPNAKITLLSTSGKSRALSLFKIIDNNLFNNVIDYTNEDKISIAKQIRTLSYDLFIELPQSFASLKTNLRNIIFAKYIGAKYAFGWEVSSTTRFKKTQAKYRKFILESERFNNILANNGLLTNKTNYCLNITLDDLQYAKLLLYEYNLSNKAKNIAIIIGSKKETNRWPIEYFKKVCIFLINKGYNMLLIGSEEDIELGKNLLSLEHVYNLAGKLTPMQSAAIIKNCALSISNDTGPMHLSYAVGTPLIGLFSNRDYPKKWYPPNIIKQHVFRSDNIPCTMCLRDTCNNNNLCMRLINPEDVIKKALDFLMISE
jgi:ADP-heptose:LPS heptosyltransferase